MKKSSVYVTGVDINKVSQEDFEEALKKADIKYDKVYLEFERVYSTLYDCKPMLREAAGG